MARHGVGILLVPPLPAAPGQLPEAGVSATFANCSQRLQRSLRSLANGREGMPPWLRLDEALTLAQAHRNQLGSAPTGLAPCFVFCSLAGNEQKEILDFFFAHCVKFQVSVCVKVWMFYFSVAVANTCLQPFPDLLLCLLCLGASGSRAACCIVLVPSSTEEDSVYVTVSARRKPCVQPVPELSLRLFRIVCSMFLSTRSPLDRK